MNIVLIKWKSKWEDFDEMIGIAANRTVADRYTKDIATKYPDCYGDRHGAWRFEDFELLEE